MTSTDPPLLSARALSRWYGDGADRFHALTDASLDVHRGESLAVVGRSGSGKTTLMHLLALLDAPDLGELFLDGTDVASLGRRRVNETRNRRFGFVFQQFFLNPGQSVLENVVLPLTIAGVPRPERHRRGTEVLRQLGLEDKARNRATALSGGQKQRAVIARALVTDPDVVFADEPTGNLDSTTGALVEDELFRLNRERGITLVVVTHDHALAARCSRQVHLHDGRVVADRQGEAA